MEYQLITRADALSDDKYFQTAYALYQNFIWLNGEMGTGAGDVAGTLPEDAIEGGGLWVPGQVRETVERRGIPDGPPGDDAAVRVSRCWYSTSVAWRQMRDRAGGRSYHGYE